MRYLFVEIKYKSTYNTNYLNSVTQEKVVTHTCSHLQDGTDNNLLIEGSWTFLESSACVARDAITIPPSRHNCINGYLLSSSKVGTQKTADSERNAVQRWMMRANEITCFRSYQKLHTHFRFQ